MERNKNTFRIEQAYILFSFHKQKLSIIANTRRTKEEHVFMVTDEITRD